MAFVRTIPPHQANQTLQQLYDQDLATYGFIANHTQSLSLRPEAVKAFRALSKAIKLNMDSRRFELATLAAAKALKSTYCMLSHSTSLKRMNAYDDQKLTAIARNYHSAGLASADVALMTFAEKVTRHAHQVSREDIEELRKHGFKDEEIVDIALTAALRNFYSKVLDALGAEPDAAYAEMDNELLEALLVGRPLEGTAPAVSP